MKSTMGQEDEMSGTQRPPLAELLKMDAETVRPWWRRMSMRERIKWAEMPANRMRRSVSLLISEGIPVDDDVPPDPEAAFAASVAGQPEVRRWVRRLQRLARDMPPGIFAVATDGGGLNVYADPDGEHEIMGDLHVASVKGRWFNHP